MKIAYIGGGSFRILQEVRTLLGVDGLMDGAEIVLFDLDQTRVAAMAAMLHQVPGAASAGLKVQCAETMEAAIEGADFVELTACPWSRTAFAESNRFSESLGFLGSDNLSLNGAFLALRSATLALDIARTMERVAPDGHFIAFTNPVAILSAVVNRGTRIPAVGVCAGVANYVHNVAYMMGWPTYRWDLYSESAGINHMAWTMKLTLDGKDFIPELAARFEAGIDYDALKHIRNYEHLCLEFPRVVYVWKTLGALHLTIEPEGMACLAFYDDEMERRSARRSDVVEPQPASAAGMGRRADSVVDAFIREAATEKPDAYWATHYLPGPIRSSPAAAVIKGLCSDAPEQIEVSLFNRGAVEGFPDDAVLEFPVCFSRAGIERKTGYCLPPVAYGLSAALVEHQTLVARAIIEQDRDRFTQAMFAYPFSRSHARVERLIEGMLHINRAELPAFMTA